MSAESVFDWATAVLSERLYDTLPTSERYEKLCNMMEPYEIQISLQNDRVYFEGAWEQILEAQDHLTELFSKFRKDNELSMPKQETNDNIYLTFTEDNSAVNVEVEDDLLPSKNCDLTSSEYSPLLDTRLLEEASKISLESMAGKQDIAQLPMKRKVTKTSKALKSSLLVRKPLKTFQYKKHRVQLNEMYCEPVEQKETKCLSPPTLPEENDIYIDITLNAQLDDVSTLLETSGILLPLMNEAKLDDESTSFSVQGANEEVGSATDVEAAQKEIDSFEIKESQDATREAKGVVDEARVKSIAKKQYEEMTPDKYFCTKCSFKTKRISHLEKHLAYHTDDCKLYSCNKCSFVAIRPWILRRHKIDAHDKGVMSCPLCSYCTDHPQLLAKHKRRKHAEPENGVTPPSAGSRRVELRCPEPGCDYGTISVQLMTRHGLRHEREKQMDLAREIGSTDFKCQQCPYGTWSSAGLERHASTVHSSARPHLCAVCGGAYKRADVLAAHVRTHHQSAPTAFECPLCLRALGHRETLNAHLSSVHSKIRTHLCATCGAAFKSSANHRKHVVTIHENPRAFPCPLCARKFNTKFTQARHLAKMHRVEMEGEAEAETETAATENVVEVVSEPMAIQANQLPVTFVPANTILVQDSLPAALDNRTNMMPMHPENPSMALLSETDNSYCTANSETAAALLYLGSYTSY